MISDPWNLPTVSVPLCVLWVGVDVRLQFVDVANFDCLSCYCLLNFDVISCLGE